MHIGWGVGGQHEYGHYNWPPNKKQLPRRADACLAYLLILRRIVYDIAHQGGQ